MDNFKLINLNLPLYVMNDSILVSYIDNFMYEPLKNKDLMPPETAEHLSNDGMKDKFARMEDKF